jgi:hypothetical protein
MFKNAHLKAVYAARQKIFRDSLFERHLTVKDLDGLLQILIDLDLETHFRSYLTTAEYKSQPVETSVQLSSLTNEMFSELFPETIHNCFEMLKSLYDYQVGLKMKISGFGSLTDMTKQSPQKERGNGRYTANQSDTENRTSDGQCAPSRSGKENTPEALKDDGNGNNSEAVLRSNLPDFFALELFASCDELKVMCNRLSSAESNISVTLVNFASSSPTCGKSSLDLANVYFLISAFSSQILSAMGNIMSDIMVVPRVLIEARMLLATIRTVTCVFRQFEMKYKNMYSEYLLRSLSGRLIGQLRLSSQDTDQPNQRSEISGVSNENYDQIFGEAEWPNQRSEQDGFSIQKSQHSGQSTHCKKTGPDGQISLKSQELNVVVEKIKLASQKLQHVPQPDKMPSSTLPTYSPNFETDSQQDCLQEEYLTLERRLSSIGEKVLLLTSLMIQLDCTD